MELANLTPIKIVEMLDKHVLGQQEAKEALALAIRNRWRRQQLPEEIRKNIKKQNILFKGPTGSGKTALLRAVEREFGWPIHFVDITQYTETGYKGKDIEDIISNFVAKYEDRPLPEWYVTGMKSKPKKPESNKTLRETAVNEVAVTVGRAWAMYVFCYLGGTISTSADRDAMVQVEDGEMKNIDLFKHYLKNYPEQVAGMYYAYRNVRFSAETDAPELNSDNEANFKLAYEGIKDSDDIPTLVMPLLCSDVGKTLTKKSEYIGYVVEFLGDMPDAVLDSALVSFDVDKMRTEYIPHMLSYNWISWMYDVLRRSGVMREYKNLGRLPYHRLSKKAREKVAEIYDMPSISDDISNLHDVWNTIAWTKRLNLDGTVVPHADMTMAMIREAWNRDCGSEINTSNPCLLNMAVYQDPLGGDAPDCTKTDKWPEMVKFHVRHIRKVLRDDLGDDYKMVRDPMKVLEQFYGLLERAGKRFANMNPKDLSSFYLLRPKSDMAQRLLGDPSELDGIVEQLYSEIRSGMRSSVSGDNTSRNEALKFIETYGIVFLDEIDKIANDDSGHAFVSRDGVQRSLLGLVEGAEYPIKSTSRLSEAVEYTFDTANLMFIAAGAFSVAPVEGLIPELRGRFPIVAEINPLTIRDYVHILKMENSHLNSLIALLGVDDVKVTITEDGYEEMAKVCETLNASANLGARRLESVANDMLLVPMMRPEDYKEGVTVDKDWVRATPLSVKLREPKIEIAKIEEETAGSTH